MRCLWCSAVGLAKRGHICGRCVAANEVIASLLLDLLAEQLEPLGIAVRAGRAVPLRRPSDLFGQLMPLEGCLLTDIGPHSRLSRERYPEGLSWPPWLYAWDRWIGRLDGDGDSNLLLPQGEQEVVPVDWGCSFCWAAPPWDAPVRPGGHLVLRVDEMDVPCHPEAERAALGGESGREIEDAIRQISDEQIWEAVTVPLPGLISPDLQVAYWSGLCARKEWL